ncbi:MAG: hypothetical protein EHM80_13935 [Nitrospiraceae bacterium]|nr:MAG: hypothetical protein EHM80_13935 [Nitrospiraceae bacterium]
MESLQVRIRENRVTAVHFMLLSKLAQFPSVAKDVKEIVAKLLYQENRPEMDLLEVSRIEDPRIRKWFENNVDSSDPVVRRIAKRVVERGKRLAQEVVYSVNPPDRRREVFSTE